MNFVRSESNAFNIELKNFNAPWKVRPVATDGTNKLTLLLVLLNPGCGLGHRAVLIPLLLWRSNVSEPIHALFSILHGSVLDPWEIMPVHLLHLTMCTLPGWGWAYLGQLRWYRSTCHFPTLPEAS